MPAYEYECKKCGQQFEVILSIQEHERQDKKKAVHCPKCQSNEVEHIIESVFVTTSKKS
ncbi:MAG TPA: zinc ribbon domain-containing protein [Candidatus Sulfotelmatobacter sp.]|nr:zinc ribbon domain-containing protein [Candidatus Sulfotelmatobacter sp.]